LIRPPLRGRGRFVCAVAPLTVALALWTSASALAAPVIGLQPVGVPPKVGYFVLNARPGATLSGKVEVTNTGSAGTVLLYPVDATTGATTGAVYGSRQKPRVEVGRWVHIASPKLTIGAGQMRVVGFRVSVPAHARAGQHLGGIVAEALSPVARHQTKRGKRSFVVKIKELAVVAVEVKLPGPGFERMTITGIGVGTQAGRQTLTLGLANTGDLLLKGSGSLIVSDQSGRRVLRRAFRLDTFVPRTRIDYPLTIVGRTLPAGHYRATVRLRYGRGHQFDRTLGFSIGSRQLRQVAQANQPPAGASRTGSPLLLIVAGVGLVLLGVAGSGAYFRAQARKVAPGAGRGKEAGGER
jgi:hypothetical protein